MRQRKLSKSDLDAQLLKKFDKIGRPAAVRIILELDDVDAGSEVLDGKWIRDLNWIIIGRSLENIEYRYNRDRKEPLTVRKVSYRLERWEG